MPQPLDRPNAAGRPPVLDEQKRGKILAALAAGSSRRAAAASVGCEPSTLTRTMFRDPDFAAAIIQAEQTLESDALRRVRKAARRDRYWRAAAWLLERRNPAEFARRPPNAYTDDQISQFFLAIIDPFLRTMSPRTFDDTLRRLHDHLALLRLRPEEALRRPPLPHLLPDSEDSQLANRGNFATHHTNELYDLAEDDLSQPVLTPAVPTTPILPPTIEK